MGNIFLLVVGFFMGFFIPGFLIIESFFAKRIPRIIKLPLGMVLSVLVSAHVVYFVSLFLGFSKSTILLTWGFWTVWLSTLVIIRKIGVFTRFLPKKKHLGMLALSIGVYLILFVSLYPAIFRELNGFFVMSANNWQDTAMHLGIIESIANGNFPIQAPYYAGVPLSYYYFSDFHTAILATLWGQFFPRILVLVNPIFTAMFFLNLYAFCYVLTKRKGTSMLVALVSTFYGHVKFIEFFRDIRIRSVVELLTNKSYAMEYMGLFQVTPMVDYFLQNRPMMVGLPGVVSVMTLVWLGFKNRDVRVIMLAGAVGAMLYKFQLFSFVVSGIVFGAGWLAFFDFKKIWRHLRLGLIFASVYLVGMVWLLEGAVNDKNVVGLFAENFKWGAWDSNKSWDWYVIFAIANFGVLLLLVLVGMVAKIAKKKIGKRDIYLGLMFLVLFVSPFLVKFTIYFADMFKFFYFMVPVGVLLAIPGWERVVRKRWLKVVLVGLVLFLTTGTSVLTLAHSYLNDSVGYSTVDLEVGMWIRENTPERAVFVGLPTVHSPITQIGGRLRTLSYINWPHSHGYNFGTDNVFARLVDMEAVYKLGTLDETKHVVDKYGADYIYLGSQERSEFSGAEGRLDGLDMLKTVYNREGVKIYEVKQ